MEKLPEEIVHQILSHLDRDSLKKAAKASQR
jgi:hypothetical protein